MQPTWKNLQKSLVNWREKKRPARDSSESSVASNSTERKSRQSKSQNPKPKEAEGVGLSYVNSRLGLILFNRLKSLGNSVTGTVIVNDSEPPYLHSATLKKSDSKCSRLYNPKGSQNTTMVYSKLF